jgi:membrane protease YdiL (CAAX protease family)
VGLGVLLTWVGGVLLTIAARRLHHFDRHIVRFERPRAEALVAIVAVLAQIVIIAFLFAVRMSTSSPSTPPLELLPRYDVGRLLIQLALVAVVFSPVLATLVVRRGRSTTVGLSTRDVIAQMMLGLAIGVVAVFALGKAGALATAGGPELLRLVAFLAVGFEEEIVFRGFLQNRLVAWVGDPRGWLLASVIFAVAHVPQDLTSDGATPIVLVDLALQLVFGIVFGWIALRVGGVWATGTAHGVADWVSWL